MRFGTVRLIGYIGFSRIGLTDFTIDFKKCKYNKVAIKAPNGFGKTTLFSALHPYPDTNNKFIPSMQAEKHLEIIDRDTIYIIKCIHPVKKVGDEYVRETTKAYITKIINGEEIELNTNGNVSSFKDILEAELGLDPNFIALSRLSSEDRGIVDKKPAERKKFVGAITDSVEVYNNMYKTLCKRSSIFRSLINNLTSKIDNIGDREKINLTLESLENRLNKKMEEKDIFLQQLASYKSKIQLLDPDGSIQQNYSDIYNQLISLNANLDTEIKKIQSIYSKLSINSIENDDINALYMENKKNIDSLSVSIQVLESKTNTLLLDREEEAKNIRTKNERLNSLQSERNYKDIEVAIKECKERISFYQSIFAKMNLTDMTISRDEFIIGINCIKEIKNIIDVFKSSSDYHTIERAIEYIGIDKYPDIPFIESEISRIESEIRQDELEYQKYMILTQISEKLKDRPSNCNINSCEFIKDALDASAQNPEDNSERLEKQLRDNNDILITLKKDKESSIEIINNINSLKSILRAIDTNASIINKLPIRNMFNDKKALLDMILDGYDFREIDELYQYIEYANIIEEYKLEVTKLHDLDNDYKIYQSKNEILDELINDINSLNNKLNTMTKSIQENSEQLLLMKKQLSQLKDLELEYDALLSCISIKNKLVLDKNDLISRYNNIKTNIAMIKECISNISITEGHLNNIEKEIVPLVKDRDTLNHSLKLLDEYNSDLEIFSAKYNKSEIIKKYSSPTKGIQTLFIELHMNKTRTMANELLLSLFNGTYQLAKYEINEDEFKIPCMGEGILNDDISSMSTSQKCMISMIISFVMLFQSSTRYNILELDEIDGGLDTQNRLVFAETMDILIEIFGIEQLIFISHNSEIDLKTCDIISLRADDASIEEGNVIFRY